MNNSIKRDLVLGKGINDSDYPVQPTVGGNRVMCPYYMRWKNMLERCYSKPYQDRWPTYIGCSVADEWLVFSAFKIWMERQNWDGKHLDKDFLVSNNKVYSPDNCLFISNRLNLALNDNSVASGSLPRGVVRSGKKYRSQIRERGRIRHLGVFLTQKDASKAYKNAKRLYLIDLIKEEGNPRLIGVSVDELINR